MSFRVIKPTWRFVSLRCLLVPGIIATTLAVPLALLPLSSALLLVAICGMMVLALIDPVWALYGVILSVPVQELTLLPGGVSYTQATLLLMVATWGLYVLAHPEQRVRGGRLLPVLLLLVWLMLFSAIHTSYSLAEAFKEVYRWSSAVLIYVVAYNTLVPIHDTHTQPARAIFWQRYWRVGGLIMCLLLATSSNAVVGIWQTVTGTGPESFRIGVGNLVRAYGTIGKPNSFAGYINMGAPLALALAVSTSWMVIQQKTARVTIFLLPVISVTTLLLLALLASFSRGGWLGAVGGIATMLVATGFMEQHKVRQRIWYGGLLATIGAVGLLLASNSGLVPDAVAHRINTITNNIRLFDVHGVRITPENFAIVERMAHMQAAWDMMIQHPFTGVGIGNYTLAYEGRGAFQEPAYAIPPWYTSRGHAHNYYIHIAAEAGIPALAAYLTLLAMLISQAWHTITKTQTQHWLLRSSVVGCCGIIGAVTVHNLFENVHVLHMSLHIASVWGMLAALEHHIPAKDNKPAW